MTISVPTATAFEYSGDSSTKAFSVPLKFLENADLTVWLVDDNGDVTEKTIGTHYTVTGAGNAMGGTVTFITAPSGTQTVKIARRTQPKQTVDLSDSGRTPGETLEAQLDRLAMFCQELEQRLSEVETTPGPPGLGAVLFGDGAPSNDLGDAGDLYEDRLTGDLYDKPSGSWVLQDNLTGPAGEQGEQGVAGDLDGFDPARVDILEQGWVPGDAKISFRKLMSDPDGWLIITSARTIGDASSGASVADTKTEDCFTALWTDYTNTELPILDSAGSASTRGVDAATDYAAHKRLPLPNPMDRFLRFASGTRAAGLKEANQNKQHTHAATFTGAALGTHQHAVSVARSHGANGNGSKHWSDGDTSGGGSASNNTNSVSAGTPSGTISVANDVGGGSEARPDSFVFTCLIKL